MSRHFAPRVWVVLLVCFVAGGALAIAHLIRSGPRTLVVALDHDILPANGYATANLVGRQSNESQSPPLTWQIVNGRNLAALEAFDAGWRLHAGVTPGVVTLVARAPGFRPATVQVQLGLDPTDQFGDGTPDFLRLQNESDRLAFRRWFAFLAESPYFQKEQDRPEEVKDCAALIRFAYREALHKHDASWANQWHLPQLPASDSVQKYEYPHTALSPGLFRIRPGAFVPDDLANGAFAQFADAESLRRYNAHFVSRDVNAARPGDLLFFRQEGHRMPFHTMIYLGDSNFGQGGNWLIYHTGPDGEHVGEIRRVTVGELQRHPQFCWRPLLQNPAFLGVYRWNILREED